MQIFRQAVCRSEIQAARGVIVPIGAPRGPALDGGGGYQMPFRNTFITRNGSVFMDQGNNGPFVTSRISYQDFSQSLLTAEIIFRFPPDAMTQSPTSSRVVVATENEIGEPGFSLFESLDDGDTFQSIDTSDFPDYGGGHFYPLKIVFDNNDRFLAGGYSIRDSSTGREQGTEFVFVDQGNPNRYFILDSVNLSDMVFFAGKFFGISSDYSNDVQFTDFFEIDPYQGVALGFGQSGLDRPTSMIVISGRLIIFDGFNGKLAVTIDGFEYTIYDMPAAGLYYLLSYAGFKIFIGPQYAESGGQVFMSENFGESWYECNTLDNIGIQYLTGSYSVNAQFSTPDGSGTVLITSDGVSLITSAPLSDGSSSAFTSKLLYSRDPE